MDDLGSLYLIMWAGVGTAGLICFITALVNFGKFSVHIHLYIMGIHLFSCIYGYFFFFGGVFQQPALIYIAIYALYFTFFMFYRAFENILSSTQKYSFIRTLLLILIALSIFDLLNHPFVLEPNKILIPLMMKIAIMGCFMGLMVITLDYSLQSAKKTIAEHLPRKFLFPPIIFACGMFIAFFELILAFLAETTTFLIIFPNLLLITFQMSIFLRYPAVLYLIPLKPLYFSLVLKSGNILYSEQLGHEKEIDMIPSVISAIRTFFAQLTQSDNKFQLIMFENLVVYVRFQQDYFVLFIDRKYHPVIQKSLDRLINRINPLMEKALESWDQDNWRFNFVKNEFHAIFSFLPNFQ